MIRRAAHLFALSGFAVAQPLYDLIGRNPEFFAAHGATRVQIVAFALVLAFVPPAVLLVVELAAGTFAPAVHVVLVAVLAGLVALQATRRLDAPELVIGALVVAAACAVAVLYARFAPMSAFLSVLAAAPVLFLALFLFTSRVSPLVLEGEAHAQVARIAPAHTPVVLVVFDELPLNSLLDRHGRIDPVRFPHFAQLAHGADWFPNATTVHDGTLRAVPAILTGRTPRPDELPRFADHPDNLFTLLGGRYRLTAFEKFTTLCPTGLCGGEGRSLTSLLVDAGVVYPHTVLPERMARRLPSVTESWGGFLDDEDDEAARFTRFVRSLDRGGRPALYYGHFLLPHSPWRYLPSGEHYDLHPLPVLWGRDEVWTDDAGLVVQSWQRHLLQTAYADGLLGRLLARLRATGLFDRSLLVVVADHGISFRPGGKRRPVSSANFEDIAFVPLLVKRPHQRDGRVLVRHMRTIDVLPTIADVLGVRVPRSVEGRSAYGGTRAPGRVAVSKDHGAGFSMPLRTAVQRRQARLAVQVSLFGSDAPPSALFGVGRHRRLLGRAAPARRRLEFDVARRGALLELTGRVPASVHDVAVTAAGRVVAVAPVYRGRFWALAPAAAVPLDAKVRVVPARER